LFSEWKNTYIVYGKQAVKSDYFLELLRIFYEESSGKDIGKIILALCGKEQPVFVFLPYKDDYVKFIIAPESIEHIGSENRVFDVGNSKFTTWSEYISSI
jgi:hypothetical protein